MKRRWRWAARRGLLADGGWARWLLATPLLPRLSAVPLALPVALYWALLGGVWSAPATAQVTSPATAQTATAQTATAAAPAATAAPRFEALADAAAPWLPASLFNAQDRAAAAAAPALRVAVSQAGVAAHVTVLPDGAVQGPQVQWLLAVAQVLGLNVVPMVFADEAAVLQAVRAGRADVVLAAAPPMAGPQPGLLYSLGTGAQPLAWVVLRDQRPVPLERARVASGGDGDAVAADWLRRHHPGATVLPPGGAAQALQAVAERRADASVGSLLPMLAVLQQTALPGLELRQVWPGAAGHRHLVLRDEQAALLPALNKAIAAWRATALPHQAVLRVAQQAAAQLRAPLALPADVAGADTAVMDRLLKAPYRLSADAAERAPLAQRSQWRVGVVKTDPTQLAAALSGLDAQGRHTGVAADMLQAVAQRLGLMPMLQPFDSEAAMLDALRAGRIDAVPLLEHTPERNSGLHYSLPWLELPQVLVGADTGPLYWGLESLRGRRLAMARTHPLRGEVQRLHPGIQWVDAADGAAALALVQQGAADAALDIKPVVQRQLGSDAGQGLRVLGDVAGFTARYRIALADGQRALLPLLDAALADIDASERQRSLQRWLVHEPVPSRPWWHSPGLAAAFTAAVALLAGLAGLVAGLWWRRPRRDRMAEPAGLADARATALVAGEASTIDIDIDIDSDSGLVARADAVQQPRAAPAAAPTHAAASPSAAPTAVPAPADAADGPRDFHLEPLLETAVLPHRRQAGLRGQSLVWALDEVLPTRIHGDPALLSRVLDLLLAHALAAVAPQGAQGRVAFKARRAALDNGHPALELAVSASVPIDAGDPTADPLLVQVQALAVTLGGQLAVRSREGQAHAIGVRVPLRGASRNRATTIAT